MKRTALLIACLAAMPVLAEQGGDAKRQEYFGRMKEIKLQGMQERISLMQEGAACVRSAQNQDAMRSCEERERSGMEQISKRMRERWESAKPR